MVYISEYNPDEYSSLVNNQQTNIHTIQRNSMHHNIEREGATGPGNHIQTFHTTMPVMGTQYPPFQTGPLGIQYQPFQSVNPGMIGTTIVPAIGTDIQPLQIKSDSSRILSDYCHVVEIPDSIENCAENKKKIVEAV